MGATPSPILRTLGLSLLALVQEYLVPWPHFDARGLRTILLLLLLGGATPLKTSSSVKEWYHFTSSLSSKMLLASKHGSPPAGRLFCSAQCWRALTYATTFSWGDLPDVPTCKNWVSWGHKLLSVKAWWCGGAWRVASLEPNSWNCLGSLKDALTSLASFLVSSFPGTAGSSIHHSGVSHLSAFHGTHSLKSKIVGSGCVFLASSSKVSGNPHRKEATISFSSGGSSKSEPLPLDPSSPGCVLGSADWLGAGSSVKWTWQHLFFCPSPLGLWWSLFLDLALDCEWAQVQFSLSISLSLGLKQWPTLFGVPHTPWLDFSLLSHHSFFGGGCHS